MKRMLVILGMVAALLLQSTENAGAQASDIGFGPDIESLDDWYQAYLRNRLDPSRPSGAGRCKDTKSRSRVCQVANSSISTADGTTIWYVCAEPSCPPDLEVMQTVATTAVKNCADDRDDEPLVICAGVADSGTDRVRRNMTSPHNWYYNSIRVQACLAAVRAAGGKAFESRLVARRGEAGTSRPRGVDVQCARSNPAELAALEGGGEIEKAPPPPAADPIDKDKLREDIRNDVLRSMGSPGGSPILDFFRFEAAGTGYMNDETTTGGVSVGVDWLLSRQDPDIRIAINAYLMASAHASWTWGLDLNGKWAPWSSEDWVFFVQGGGSMFYDVIGDTRLTRRADAGLNLGVRGQWKIVFLDVRGYFVLTSYPNRSFELTGVPLAGRAALGLAWPGFGSRN